MALIESHYSVNVSKASFNPRRSPYLHYLRIELGSKMEDEALDILADTRKRYPAPDFKVTMTYVNCVGHRIGGEHA